MNTKRRKIKVIESLMSKIQNTFDSRLYLSYTKRLIITIVLLLVLSLSCFMITSKVLKLGKQEVITYKEKGTTDYKVYLKQNTFYEKDYLEKGMMYVASLIKNINLTFDYAFQADAKLDYTIDYDVMAKINITNPAGTSVIFEKDYTLKENQKLEYKDKDKIEIKENVIIDYDYYNRLANSFKSTYEIEPSSNLIIYIKINKIIKESGEVLSIPKDTKMDISIPLTQKTVDISIDESKVENSSTATKSVQFSLKNIILMTIAVVLFIACVIVFIEMTELISLLAPQTSKYDRKIKRILKDYSRYIVTSNTNLDFSSKTVIDVNTFDELMDVRDSLKVPIVYHSIIDHHECEFYLQHEDIVYNHKIKSIDLDKEEETKKEKQQSSYNKVFRGEFKEQKQETLENNSIIKPISIKPLEPAVEVPAPTEIVPEEKTSIEPEKEFVIEEPIFKEEPVQNNVEVPYEKEDSIASELEELSEVNTEFSFGPEVIEEIKEEVKEEYPDAFEEVSINQPEINTTQEEQVPVVEEIDNKPKFNISDILPKIPIVDNIINQNEEPKKVEVKEEVEEKPTIIKQVKNIIFPDIPLNVENFKFDDKEEEYEEKPNTFSFSSVLPRFKDAVDSIIKKEDYEEENPFYIEQPDIDSYYEEPVFESVKLEEELEINEEPKVEIEEVKEEIIDFPVVEDLVRRPDEEEKVLELLKEEPIIEPIKEEVVEPEIEKLEVVETKKMDIDEELNKVIEARVEKLVKKKLSDLLKDKETEKPKKEEKKETKKSVKKTTKNEEKEEKPQPKKEVKEEVKEKVEEVKEEKPATPKKESKKQKTLVDYEKELEAILTRNFNKEEIDSDK